MWQWRWPSTRVVHNNADGSVQSWRRRDGVLLGGGLSAFAVSAPRPCVEGGKRNTTSTTSASQSQRRAPKLCRAERAHYLQDQRSKVALQRQFTMSEQWATNGFKDTVVFEPFRGTCGITHWAFQEYSWTGSQPIEWLDGYDLLASSGRSIERNVQPLLPYV